MSGTKNFDYVKMFNIDCIVYQIKTTYFLNLNMCLKFEQLKMCGSY